MAFSLVLDVGHLQVADQEPQSPLVTWGSGHTVGADLPSSFGLPDGSFFPLQCLGFVMGLDPSSGPLETLSVPPLTPNAALVTS